jgi:hypothetical protein
LPAAPSDDDLQACLQQTGDYVTRGKTVLYVIGLANSCNKRLRCEIFANVTGSRGSVTGHTVMTLGAAGGGAAAKQTYSMHVKAAAASPRFRASARCCDGAAVARMERSEIRGGIATP